MYEIALHYLLLSRRAFLPGIGSTTHAIELNVGDYNEMKSLYNPASSQSDMLSIIHLSYEVSRQSILLLLSIFANEIDDP